MSPRTDQPWRGLSASYRYLKVVVCLERPKTEFKPRPYAMRSISRHNPTCLWLRGRSAMGYPRGWLSHWIVRRAGGLVSHRDG